MAQYGPPSIGGSIDSFVDTAIGGIKDYRTGQMLENLPKTADGSIDYQAAAAAMYRTNPGLAAQFLKMEELRGLQSYRNRSLNIQEKALEEKGEIISGEGKQFIYGPGKVLRGWVDIETGQYTPAGGGQARPTAAPQAQPQKQPTPEHIEMLKANPALAPQFDDPKAYGPGASARILGGGGGATAAPTTAAPAPTAASAAPLPPLPPNLSYTEKKEGRKGQIAERVKVDQTKLKEADDNVQSGRVTLQTIGEMLKLNETAFHGPFAEKRGQVAALTGIGGKQAGSDTVVLQNKITGGALEQLRATFGGNPTEGERTILLQVQGSVGQDANTRKRIFTDAAELVRRRIKFNQKYANAQRSGQYLDPTYTDNTPVD